MIRILCIGNSFSQDATRYLDKIAGGELFVRNCYIGGCSLERHRNNMLSGERAYSYEDATAKICDISLEEALNADQWDYVTVQQVSQHAGIATTYEPYLSELLAYIREKTPQAKIVFHQTWAYEIGAAHDGFALYARDQKVMFDAIVAATRKIAQEHDLLLLPTGEAIQRLRALPEFDYANGGLSLNRDGYHLSYNYGRYAAALSWYVFFTGKSAKTVTYQPDFTDKKLLELIRANI